MQTGVLKGVGPLHGVTGVKRRREGAGPLAGARPRATSNTHPLRHTIKRKMIQSGAPVSTNGWKLFI